MATILWANNAQSTLAGAITDTATTANLAAGTGVLFPSPGANQYFVMTFNDAATGLLREIVHVTNVSTDTITMVRAQEGTTALAWNAGDLALNLVTAGTMQALQQIATLPATATGQCTLALSGGNLVLSPKGGSYLVIDGVAENIPSSGVSLAATGLTPSTPYYIYAYMNGSTMTLEASTTGHSTDTTAGNVGIEIKTGDSTRSLVGYWLVTTGPAWSTTAVQGLNWFNRQAIKSPSTTSGETWTASSLTEIPSFPRLSFLTWATDGISARCAGSRANSSSGTLGSDELQISIDGSIPGSLGGGYVSQGSIQSGNFFTFYDGFVSEGLHYATLFAAVTGGTTGTLSSTTISLNVMG